MEIVYSTKTGRWVKKDSKSKLPRRPVATLICGASRTDAEIESMVRQCVEGKPLPITSTLKRGDSLTLRNDSSHTAVLLEHVQQAARPLKARVVCAQQEAHVGQIFYYSADEIDVGIELTILEVYEPPSELSMQMQGKFHLSKEL